MTSTLTSKGQVTIPKEIRDYLGLCPGAAVRFHLGPGGEVLVQPADATPAIRRHGLDKLRGTLASGKRTDTLMRLLRGYDADPRDPGLK